MSTSDRGTTGTTGAPSTTTQSTSAMAQRIHEAPQRAEASTTASQPGSAMALTTEAGTTHIADSVVAKIAGLAARDIPGVYSMGAGMARRMGQLKSLVPGSESSTANQGVSVEVGEREAAIDLDIVTWYGQSIVDVCEAVRRNVIGQVQGMTGLNVVEVNIQVGDIHVQSEEPQREPRVQ